MSISASPRPSPASGPEPVKRRTITVGTGEACRVARVSDGRRTRGRRGAGARLRVRVVRTRTPPDRRARTGAEMAWVTTPLVRTSEVSAEYVPAGTPAHRPCPPPRRGVARHDLGGAQVNDAHERDARGRGRGGARR